MTLLLDWRPTATLINTSSLANFKMVFFLKTLWISITILAIQKSLGLWFKILSVTHGAAIARQSTSRNNTHCHHPSSGRMPHCHRTTQFLVTLMLFQLHVDMLIISRWNLIGGFGRKKKHQVSSFSKQKSLDRLVVVVVAVAAVRTVKFARYMEERAEAKAPARWKTLQLLIQPSTCSLSCVCLNVNSDCVRPRVKRIAVTPPPFLLSSAQSRSHTVWQFSTGKAYGSGRLQ